MERSSEPATPHEWLTLAATEVRRIRAMPPFDSEVRSPTRFGYPGNELYQEFESVAVALEVAATKPDAQAATENLAALMGRYFFGFYAINEAFLRALDAASAGLSCFGIDVPKV